MKSVPTRVRYACDSCRRMHDLGTLALLFAFLGGIGGGFVNSVAGGGTLVTFPVLTAIGIPSLDANITNAVALSPGYAGGVLAQRDDFGGRRDLARALAITAIGGGITGGVLLLVRLISLLPVFCTLVPPLPGTCINSLGRSPNTPPKTAVLQFLRTRGTAPQENECKLCNMCHGPQGGRACIIVCTCY